MDLRTLNTLKLGDRVRMAKAHKDVGIRAGEVGTVTAIARDAEAPEFPTVYVQLDSSHLDLLACENELMLSPDCYLGLTDEDRGINSRIDPESIVGSMEKILVPRSPIDEQGLHWPLSKAEAA
jgi:hypothetical protein